MTKRKMKLQPKKEAEAPSEKKAKRETAPRQSHSLSTTYEGKSSGFNGRKSRTAIPVSEFGLKPDLVFTPRTENILKAAKSKYGKKPFARLDMDAAIIKYGIWKGVLKHVEGDATSESTTFQFIA